jgi:hypothetical protein
MGHLWRAALGAALLLGGCASVPPRKPVEVDMPASSRHFIVQAPERLLPQHVGRSSG